MAKRKKSKRRSYSRKKRNGPVTDGALKLAGLAALGGAAYYGYKSFKGRLAPPAGATVVLENELVLGEGQKVPYIIWQYPQEKGGLYGWSRQTPKSGRLDIPEVFSSEGGFMTAEDAELDLMESVG